MYWQGKLENLGHSRIAEMCSYLTDLAAVIITVCIVLNEMQYAHSLRYDKQHYNQQCPKTSVRREAV